MPLDRQAALAQAEKLVARGKIDAAIKEYRKLHLENPTDLATANRLGDLLVRKGATDEAVELFLRIAKHYVDDGFHVKAIAILKKILKLDPTRFEVYEQLAELYHRQGLKPEALAQCQVLVEYYLKHGRRDEALRVLGKIREIDPEDAAALAKLAELEQQAGRIEAALGHYRGLGDLLLQSGRRDEAVQVLKRAIALAPKDLAFVTDAVLSLREMGHTGAAASLLAFAVERNPQAERVAELARLRGSKSKAPPVLESRREEEPALAQEPPSPGVGVPRVHPEEELVLELPSEEEPPTTAVRVTEAMLDRSPVSPWYGGASSTGSLEVGSAGPESLLDIELELDIPAEEAAASSESPAAVAERPSGSFEWSFESSLLELPEPAISSLEAASGWEAEAPVSVGAAPELVSPREQIVPEKPRPPRLDEIVAEAEVLGKYGLKAKALEKLQEVFARDPRHLGGLALQVEFLLEEGKVDRALGPARQLAEVARERGDRIHWEPIRNRLIKLGFRFEDDLPQEAPRPQAPTKSRRDSVSALLDELVGVTQSTAPKPTAKPPAKKPSKEPEVGDLLAKLEGEFRAPKASEKSRSAAPLVPPRAPESKPTLEKPLAIAPSPKEQAAEPTPPPSAAASVTPPSAPRVAPTPPPPAAPADLGPPASRAPEGTHRPQAPATPVPPSLPAAEQPLAWLDRAAPTASPGARADEELFEEEGFFDLAAELERELSEDELTEGISIAPPQEQSLEEIVEGFKRGVAESLSPEDYDTHFNLGIAYREMGLLDEAIGEFQLAAKSADYLLDCCSLLGACFLEKGLPDLAIRWYQKGLSTPNLSEEATLGLLYDLGNLYQTIGESDKARKTFVEIYGLNSNYRDVVARLEELGG